MKTHAVQTGAPSGAADKAAPQGVLAEKAAIVLMQILYAARYARFASLRFVAELVQCMTTWDEECDTAICTTSTAPCIGGTWGTFAIYCSMVALTFMPTPTSDEPTKNSNLVALGDTGVTHQLPDQRPAKTPRLWQSLGTRGGQWRYGVSD